MAKRRRKRIITPDDEDWHQIELAKALDLAGILWAHCPNGLRTSRSQAGKFKKMGMKAGVHDVLVFDRPVDDTCARIYTIELKRPELRRKTKPNDWSHPSVSPAQRAFKDRIEAAGGRCKLAFDFLEAIDWLKAEGFNI